jgi:hypothetical protein
MAGHGPAPKPAATRRRRNKPDLPAPLPVTPDDELRGPELPDVFEEAWHSRTQAWWLTWRRSAQAQAFTETDWDFLIDTALMHHTMWSKGRWEFAAELRLRAAKFGATPEDRMRLKIQIEHPTTPRAATGTDGTVTDINSRRARLTEE